MTDSDAPPDSLLPYATWTERALLAVVRDALEHTARHGLPGEHHFYLTFRTDAPGVVIPGHLKAKYPEEITIVLQHKFWDLKVDRKADSFSVGLSFGNVGTTLVVPFAALTAFADPQVRFGLRFTPAAEAAAAEQAPAEEPPPPSPTQQVISLDAFRRRPSRE